MRTTEQIIIEMRQHGVTPENISKEIEKLEIEILTFFMKGEDQNARRAKT